MRAGLVVVAACASAPAVVAPPKRTGPELVMATPGATAFAIDGSDVFWLAPGAGVFEGSAKLADAGSDAFGLVRDGGATYWGTRDGVYAFAAGSASTRPMFELRAFAIRDGKLDAVISESDDRATFLLAGSARIQLDGDDPVVAAGAIAGTSTTLYQGSAATPIAGGVRALAVDGDDIFFANAVVFEKYGHGPVNQLGPAGGAVTAIAVDDSFVYWAIAGGDRDPAIYRAKRSKPELELVTRVGSAAQLILHDAFIYWLDPVEGAIHRIAPARK